MPQNILKKYWGFDAFRAGQLEAIQAVLEGKDTLVLMPTGGGKSICYQVPALSMEGVCLVVTPLIALMKDQVERLREKGIKAELIHSGISHREIDTILDNCIYGNVKFLYCSPERLTTELMRERVQKMEINILVVDEAHCISQWGYDFRPSYLEIGEFRQFISSAPMIALTASATDVVQKDIIKRLGLREPEVFSSSYYRENLVYGVRKVEDKFQRLLEVVQKVNGSAIVYTRSRKSTKEIAGILSQEGISAEYYHGGLNHDERDAKQNSWINNKKRVMVATNAFGMGIDKPDVRLVAHVDMPEDIESYYQEAGRAGRDGRRAFCVLFYTNDDIDRFEEKVQKRLADPGFLKECYQSLANFTDTGIGFGAFRSFDFNLKKFCAVYKYDYLTTYHALNKLSELELIQFSEDFYQPSKLRILINNKQAYDLNIRNPKLGEVLKAALRLYGGELFSTYDQIDEVKIARIAEVDQKELVERLERMHKMKIVHYIPAKDEPQVMFLTPRYDPKYLPVDTSTIKDRNRILQERASKMIDYALQTRQCRSIKILDYFGEIKNEPCGQCDVCLESDKRPTKNSSIESKIQSLLEEKPHSPQRIKEQLTDFNDTEIISSITRLLDEGTILYNDKGEVLLNR